MDPLAAGLGALQGERGCSGLRVQVRASRCAHAGCAHGSPRLLLVACRARGLGPSIGGRHPFMRSWARPLPVAHLRAAGPDEWLH